MNGISGRFQWNVHTSTDKTYHLIVSFRDEKPAPDKLREIEQSIAKALGFEEHQRTVGTHQNTDNFHMHIAYNKIHPESLVLHSPYQDFKALSNVCRELEQAYGLKGDPGMEESKNKSQAKTNQAAKDYEALHGSNPSTRMLERTPSPSRGLCTRLTLGKSFMKDLRPPDWRSSPEATVWSSRP